MTEVTKKRLSIVGGIAVASLVAVLLVLIVRRAGALPVNPAPLITEQALDEELKSKNVLLVGAVENAEGGASENASVTFSLHNGDGQVVWRMTRPVAKNGFFRIQLEDLPNIPNLYAGTLAAEAPDHLAEKVNVSVDLVRAAVIEQPTPTPSPTAAQSSQPAVPFRADTEARKTTISPQRVHLRLAPYSPWLTLIVLIPALLGLVLAVLHLTQFWRGSWVTYGYTLGVASLWAFVVFGLIWLNLSGKSLIPLFWSDFFVSSGVVIFAFIGNIIYVAYAISEKRNSFFDADEATRKGLLLRLGGRVLVAPYIALAAYGIFAATFPTLRTGPFAAFFGFFAGLWIKPILEALHDIGVRLLSAEEQQKIAAEATRAENPNAPAPQTSSALAPRPEQGFLDAVNAVRQELLKKPNVIGVVPTYESVPEGARKPNITVYVYKEQEPGAGDQEWILANYRGFDTKIVALPPAGPDQVCSPMMSRLSWSKIHKDNLQRIKGLSTPPRPATAMHVDGTQILLVLDPDQTLFNNAASDLFHVFDVMGAHEIIKPLLKKNFEFVSFAIDTAGLPDVSDYHVPVFNDVLGINYEKAGNPGSLAESDKWDGGRLRACFVRSKNPLSLYRYLHEFGHYWCSYVTFNAEGKKDSSELLDSSEDQQGLYHWGVQFDNQFSPMDYDRIRWIPKGNNTFEKQELNSSQVEYCALELYLMGLLPADRVDDITILRNINPPPDADAQTHKAEPFNIRIENIIDSCGKRTPPFGQAQTTFTQALVVISSDAISGEKFATTLETNFRTHYEQKFHEATRNVGNLRTTLNLD